MPGRGEGPRCGGVAREAGHAAPPVSHMAEQGETEAVAWWGAGLKGVEIVILVVHGCR